MLLLVATIKPENIETGDWSYYCRLKLEETAGKGRWSLINGPFFPFSKDAPEARSGDWEYRAGTLFFWADGNDPMRFVMTFDRLHWNFRVVCTQKELQGKGRRSSIAGGDADRLRWVLGPGVRKVPVGEVYTDPVQFLPVNPFVPIPNYVPDGSDPIVPLPNYRPDDDFDGRLNV
jgi:hypothetical protein